MSPSLTYDLIQLSQGLTRFGDVSIPGSKSSTLRALLLGSQCKAITRIQNVLRSDDTAVMISALEHLGASIKFLDETNMTISGPLVYSQEEREIDLGESGLSLRLLLVHLSLFGKAPVRFHGKGRLLDRPLKGLIDTLRLLGVSILQEPQSIRILPCKLPNKPQEISIDPSVSSQWVSALALALAHHPFGGTIHFAKSIVSKSYLDLTSYWLNIFGCVQSVEPNQWVIPGGLTSPGDCMIEGDWSSAAVFILASATQGLPICIKGLNKEAPQGDRFLLDILLRSSVKHQWKKNDLYIEGKIKTGIYEDLSSCPDLAPVLAIACSIGTEPCRLSGLQTLPGKESDRLKKIKELVLWLGGRTEIRYNSEIIIYPRAQSSKPIMPFDPSGDHRMAFAFALGALDTGGTILDPLCVNKTFPNFWMEWSKMSKQGK
jgi:3-phosphoshikimate 1-carboxyvinyltransferase